MTIVCKTDWSVDKSLEYLDINRVESNIQQIQSNIQAIGFITTLEPIKTDWNMTKWCYISEFNRIKRNINTLRANFYVYPTTPTLVVNTNTEQAHDWKIQNIMEQILYDLNSAYILWIRSQATTQMYADNFYSGEEVIL